MYLFSFVIRVAQSFRKTLRFSEREKNRKEFNWAPVKVLIFWLLFYFFLFLNIFNKHQLVASAP